MTSASTVSHTLRLAGFRVVQTRSREGIRVRRTGLPGWPVVVVPSFDSDRHREESCRDLEIELKLAGFTTYRPAIGQFLYVRRSFAA